MGHVLVYIGGGGHVPKKPQKALFSRALLGSSEVKKGLLGP